MAQFVANHHIHKLQRRLDPIKSSPLTTQKKLSLFRFQLQQKSNKSHIPNNYSMAIITTTHLSFPLLLSPYPHHQQQYYPKPNPTVSFRRSIGVRAQGGVDKLGDFGARDPFPAEVASGFADKVLGNVDTAHKILIPNISALSLSQQQCTPLSPFQAPMSTPDAQKLLKKVLLFLTPICLFSCLRH